MVGFLLQWPTLATLVMFPILLVVYSRLAAREERDGRSEVGAAYDDYAQTTPRFLPRLRDPGDSGTPQPRAMP
jgi:protein-S-isoprenylcysteine O-methyltransferase Ste14